MTPLYGLHSHNCFKTVNKNNGKDRNEKTRTVLNFKISKTFYNRLFHKITSHLHIQMEM